MNPGKVLSRFAAPVDDVGVWVVSAVLLCWVVVAARDGRARGVGVKASMAIAMP